MANELKMEQIHTLLLLAERGWPQRRIARELGIHRETVARHIRLAAEASAKPANSTPGSVAEVDEAKPAISTPGSDTTRGPKPANSTPGIPGRQSCCAEFRAEIIELRKRGLSAVRIHEDLVADHDFEGSYQSVKRFVRKLVVEDPVAFRRLEVLPGAEAQIDFGQGAFVVDSKGKRRRPHMLRVVLSHSRKGYAEVVWRQSTDDLIRCLENAFWSFGGVPETMVIDNLKAAVSRADWFDPELCPKFASFAKHYGVAVLPTKPYTPRHKGKVEGGVKYVQENALKARTFSSLDEQNQFLKHWEATKADLRIHGTTRKQVASLFESAEKPALRSLPATRFPCFHEGRRKVHRDGHIALANAYYSVPPEYTTREVWVRWDTHLVRIYDVRLRQIAVHSRREPGEFSTHDAHISSKKRSAVEGGEEDLLRRVRLVGEHSEKWAKALLKARGVEGLRPLIGFLSLTKKHSSSALEDACRVALRHEMFHLRPLRQLLAKPLTQEQSSFLDTHPLIRDLAEYGSHVRRLTHE